MTSRLQVVGLAVQSGGPEEVAAFWRERARTLRDVAGAWAVAGPDEVAGGSPPGALRLVRGFLELRIEKEVPDFGQKLLDPANRETAVRFLLT